MTMSRIKLIKKLIQDRNFCMTYFIEKFGKWIPDKTYLCILYRLHMGKKINMDNPKTFNEKLQWLKLYNRKPIYTTMVDKYEVKKFVSDIIGEQYVVKLFGVWNTPDDIDWNSLPSKFVLKTTHDGGGNSIVICKDKDKLDIEAAIKKLKVSMKHEIYSRYREWPYKNVKHRVIAEQLLEDNSGEKELIDYKVMCFNGIPKLIQVHRGRFEEHTQDFYDNSWNRLQYTQGLPMSDKPMKVPPVFEEMMAMSAKLSKDIPFLRVDWYIVEGRLYFGELTFFDASGYDDFDQEGINEEVGSWIDLTL